MRGAARGEISKTKNPRITLEMIKLFFIDNLLVVIFTVIDNRAGKSLANELNARAGHPAFQTSRPEGER